MPRNRLFVLSSFLVAATGALVFACSSGDDNADSGTDSGGKDATTDSAADTGKKDTGTEATGNDASDASDATATETGSDAGAGLTFMVVRAGGTVDAGTDASLS